MSKYLCYLYTFLWILYGLQQFLMLSGVIAQSIFVVLMVMSFYACYTVNRYYHVGPFIKGLNILLIMITVYGIAYMINGYISHGFYNGKTHVDYTYLQDIYISMMPLYAFYYYSIRGRLNAQNITFFFFVLLIFSVLSYYQKFFMVTTRITKSEITNNIGFLFVPLIPMLLLVKIKDVWKYVLLVFIFSFIMMSMKRGAILSGTIMVVLFMRKKLNVKSNIRFLYVISATLIAIVSMYFFVANLYESSPYFQRRLALTLGGYSSGRDVIFSYFYHYFLERTTAIEFLLGRGANATIDLYGRLAHNDWLEFAINQGILGVLVYLFYWIGCFLEWKYYKGNNNCRAILGILLLCYFIIPFFNHSIDNMPLAATLCIGYCLAMNRTHKFVTITK